MLKLLVTPMFLYFCVNVLYRVMLDEEGTAEKNGPTRRAEPDEEALFFF